jgi:ectoine hydroxylase-related dioxygenase (phytanoyl-CoA dioxygenase family)
MDYQKQIENDADEIINGKGFVVIPNVFTKDEIKEAKDLIDKNMDLLLKQADKKTTIQGDYDNKKDSANLVQGKIVIWNLVYKGKIFEKMAQKKRIVDVFKKILGNSVGLGSFAARIVNPGDKSQLPHVDYPYFDMYKLDRYPKNINFSFLMNCQSTIMIDDFTEDNGSTALVPRSQKWGTYPNDKEKYFNECTRVTGESGSAFLMTGACWHGSYESKENAGDRRAILGQYLPGFVKPMEDWEKGSQFSGGEEIKNNFSEDLNKLLFGYNYPRIMQDAD